jgi:predicted AAA+ superfamily ATPase
LTAPNFQGIIINVIHRSNEVAKVKDLLKRHPVVGIVGARQVGKTTLARFITETYTEPAHFFDLENPEDLARLSEPMLALKNLKGLIILDEIQRKPDLFPILRVLVDRNDNSGRFLVLGSASPALLKQSSETLAGRIIYHTLGGFTATEINSDDWNKLWLRGGFPRSFLAGTDEESMEWRHAFIQTFVERDIPQLGITIASNALRRFWVMLAHYHGQIWHSSEFARSFGVADTTVRRYLDVLSSALVVRQLQPWYENLKKRQVKSPKPYIIDSGLLHGLLNLSTERDVESHPKLGASWEGFIIEQLIRHLGMGHSDCYYWATHAGAELDLLTVRGSRRKGFEIKRTTAPAVTPSMRSALKDLRLSSLDVIHAGEHTFMLNDKIRAVSFSQFLKDIEPV